MASDRRCKTHAVLVDPEERLGEIRELRAPLMELCAASGTPMYAYDRREAARNLRRFVRAFAAADAVVNVCYAIKSNPYPGLLETVVKAGHGLDASSRRELQLALQAGAQRIVFTGPGKSRHDIDLVLGERQRISVHLESIGELRMLGQLARAAGVRVRCGLRLCTKHQRRWSKFGIPLEELPSCWRIARRFPQLQIVGLHFHSGTLSSPAPVMRTLGAVGELLRELPAKAVQALSYVDIGGGFPPEAFEGIYPWNRSQSMSFDRNARTIERILNDEIRPHYELAEVLPVEIFARRITAAVRRHLLPLCPQIALWAEPGKYISHSVLHLLFEVVERKGPNAVIVNGGTNMIGWEKYEYFDYAPIFNLTRFAPARERPLLVYGNLCTPHDLWGYYLRGRTVRIGDLLCLPYQGAYTYTLAQSFIRNIPAVVDLEPPSPGLQEDCP